MIYLILEYCDGGDLGDYISRHGKVTDSVARDLMRQLGMLLLCLQLVCFVLGLYAKCMSVSLCCYWLVVIDIVVIISALIASVFFSSTPCGVGDSNL